MSAWQIGVAANLVVGVAYLAIFWSILSPLLRARDQGLNLLGVATSAIFLTCAFHHAGHALVTISTDHAHTASSFYVALVGWDVVTMAVGVYYWTLRRGYGQFVQGGQLFADLQSQRREAAEQAALRRVATAVAEARTPEAVSDIAARELGALLGAEAVLVTRSNGGAPSVLGAFGDEDEDLRERLLRPPAPSSGGGAGPGASGPDAVGGVAARIELGSREWGTVLVVPPATGARPRRELEQSANRFADLVGLGVANAAADAARRAAEAALATERDHASSIIAALRDGLVVSSPEGEILDVNEPFLEMVGLGRSQVVGAQGPPFPWWDPEDDAALGVVRGVRQDGLGEFDASYVRRGTPFPVHVSVASRRGPRGENLGLVATCRDMGPWRDAQEELRRREASQRQSEALLAAEREAQRLKDEFLAMVSHELRTPLSAVVGYLELAIADTDDPEVRDLLQVAERNGHRLSGLVRDILLVAQAGAGRLGLQLRSVELGELVSQAVLAARPSAGAKSIDLEEDVTDSPRIYADPDRLGQVLDNLISNAIKFSPAGSRVKVGLEVGAGRVRITVADDGPGIPDEERPHLFEPFFRARQAARDVVAGSGIGLAVVKAIAEAHGGSVAVESELGRGSVFWADLPLRPAGTDRQDTA